MPPVEAPLNPYRVAQDAKLLHDIQGNILNPHGRDFTRLVLFRFDDGPDGRELRKLFSDAVRFELVTTASRQWLDARSGVTDRPFYSLGITVTGMQRCGYETADFPLQGMDYAGGFPHSMREASAMLGDPQFDPKAPAPTPKWDEQYLNEPHGVWLLAHDHPAKLDAMQTAVKRFLEARHATPTFVEKGHRWYESAKKDFVREPFGFRDGLSQPEFFAGPDYDKTPDWIRLPRKQVLIQDGSVHDGGSFLVLRKLEQDVKAFRKFERDRRKDPAWKTTGVIDPGALLVGRERDGTPLAMVRPGGRGPNDFDFDDNSSRCPFHAHIRKSNARVHPGVRGTDPNAVQQNREALFVRRSAVYDDNAKPKLPAFATDQYPAGDAITEGGRVGLLFMGYMSSIKDQFFVLQRNWYQAGNFPMEETKLGDAMLLPRSFPPGGPPAPWSWPGPTGGALKPCPLPQFVHPKGGAYFYMPPISWLQTQSD